MDGGAWWATVHRVSKSLVGHSPRGLKESDTAERLHFTSLHFNSSHEVAKVLEFQL